jgi:hypothetical protein
MLMQRTALLLLLPLATPVLADSAEDQRVKTLTAQCETAEAKVKGSQAEKDCMEGMRLMVEQINRTGQEVQQMLSNRPAVQDARLVSSLDALGLNYKASGNGGARMTMDRGEGRTQQVFIESKTYSLQKNAQREFREVWSIGAVQKQPFTEAQVRDLLARNVDYIVGAWSIRKTDEGEYRAIITAPIPADVSDQILSGTIAAITVAADDVEQVLTNGKDDF